MKTQSLNKRLGFYKSSVLELNEAQLIEVNGGTTPVCVYVVGVTQASSPSCAAGLGAAVGGFIAWTIN